jgi:hypothetical protein
MWQQSIGKVIWKLGLLVCRNPASSQLIKNKYIINMINTVLMIIRYKKFQLPMNDILSAHEFNTKIIYKVGLPLTNLVPSALLSFFFI